MLAVKSTFWGGKRGFSEAPGLIRASYFLPAEGKIVGPSLTHNTIQFSIQPNMNQSWNKVITSLPTNPLLFNKQ